MAVYLRVFSVPMPRADKMLEKDSFSSFMSDERILVELSRRCIRSAVQIPGRPSPRHTNSVDQMFDKQWTVRGNKPLIRLG
jgi:hypothetical protein